MKPGNHPLIRLKSKRLLWLWRRFTSQPSGKRALLLEAAFWLTAARLAVAFVPFPRISRFLGGMRSPEPGLREYAHSPAPAREIGWAIERVAAVLPFPVVCLPRGLAAWQMLHRRGVPARLHFGVPRAGRKEGIQAHAWLDSCGVEVCGYPEAMECVEIGFFGWPADR